MPACLNISFPNRAALLCLAVFLPLFVISTNAWAQLGGKSTFAFLEMPNNAHLAGIGGQNVSIRDRDVNFFLSNPALLNKEMDNHLSLNLNPYFSGSSNSSAAYAKSFGEAGTFAGAVSSSNYGTFNGYDLSGNPAGTFNASEYLIALGYARQSGNFSAGLNLKFAGSNIETYSAHALCADLGAVFKHPTRDFTVGLAVKNIGFTTDGYTSASASSLPLNVQLGAGYKLEHMPLRFSVTLQHLEKFDITYLDGSIATSIDASGNPVYPKKTGVDKVLRHFVFGSEFIFSQHFRLLAGWNLLANKELKLTNTGGSAGFSLGGMLKVGAFEFGYSHAWYHPAGGTDYLTLSTDFSRIFRKKEQVLLPVAN